MGIALPETEDTKGERLVELLTQRAEEVTMKSARAALGLDRATAYRRLQGRKPSVKQGPALAKQLFAEAISRYDIEPGNLIVHQDRGAPMTSHGFAELLGELGVERSYSRLRVSNDNPFSESLFHTTKYQPDYPGRLADVQQARRWCAEFFQCYSESHHHTGLALFTPADVYFYRVEIIARRREEAPATAYAEHPERFVAGPPRVERATTGTSPHQPRRGPDNG